MFHSAFKDKTKENLEKELKSFDCLFLPLPQKINIVLKHKPKGPDRLFAT